MLLYVTVMVHPLVPILCDAWCHSFSEINHIATIHAKYGTHHLEISLSKTSEKNNEKSTSKIDSSDSQHIFIKVEKTALFQKVACTFPSIDLEKIIPIFIGLNTPPPKIYC